MMHIDALSRLVSLLLLTVGSLFIVSAPVLFVLWVVLLAFIFLNKHTRTKGARALVIIFGVPVCLLIFHSIAALSLGGTNPNAPYPGIHDSGLVIAGRVGIAIAAALLFVWSVDYRELHSGMVRYGVPYPLSMTVYLALRYVALIRFYRREIRDAIKVRVQGVRVPFFQRIRLELSYLFLLFIAGLRAANFTADAIVLRGRDQQRGRPLILPQLHIGLGGVILVASASVIVLVAILISRAQT